MHTLRHSAGTKSGAETEGPKLNFRAEPNLSRRIKMHAAAVGKLPGAVIAEILDAHLPEYEVKGEVA